MILLLRLAVRNLRRHAWRTTATVLGVGLGIAAVLATLSVGANVRANVRGTLEAAAGKADLLVTPGAGGRAVFEVAPVLALLADEPGVEALYPVLNFRAEPVRETSDFEASVIPGVDSGFQLSGRLTEVPDDLPAELTAGRFPRPGANEVALAVEFAEGRGIALGDTVAFATRFGEAPFEVSGLLDSSIGFPSTNGGRVGIVALEDLRRAVRLPRRASFVEVLATPGSDTAELQARLEEALARFAEGGGDSLTVTLPAGSGDVTSGIVDTLQAGLSVLAATLMALGGFMAYNTFMAAVVERTGEYALLRTIALRRRDVQRLALLEAALVSALGVLVGLLLGVALAYAITLVNAAALGFEFRRLVVPYGAAALASLVGVAVALLAGVLPARAASRTPPLAARRQSDEAAAPRLVRLGWGLVALGVAAALLPWAGHWALVGAALAMALFFTGVTLATRSLLPPALRLLRPLLERVLGVAGRLGSGFTERNGARNGVAIGTVIVGTGLIVGVGAMVAGINHAIRSWVETTVVGDLFVTSPVSFPADFERRAATVTGVDAVSGVGIRVVRYQPEAQPRGRSVALILVDPERFDPDAGFGSFQFIQGQGDNRSGYEALTGGELLAANTIRERFGVGRGDRVELRTADGFAEFPVAGVVVDFTGGGETFVASIELLERFGGGTPDLYVMTVQPDADPEAVREALLARFPELYLDITLNASYQRRILELTQRSFTTTNALLLLAVFIAALGVANTLGMNLSSRQHEIAVLRTLGLTRAGVRRLIVAEGMVILTVGTALGVAFGLLLAQVITSGAAALTGYQLVPVYPWRLVALALLVAPLVGLLASLLPARRAAQLEPVVALQGPT